MKTIKYLLVINGKLRLEFNTFNEGDHVYFKPTKSDKEIFFYDKKFKITYFEANYKTISFCYYYEPANENYKITVNHKDLNNIDLVIRKILNQISNIPAFQSLHIPSLYVFFNLCSFTYKCDMKKQR